MIEQVKAVKEKDLNKLKEVIDSFMWIISVNVFRSYDFRLYKQPKFF